MSEGRAEKRARTEGSDATVSNGESADASGEHLVHKECLAPFDYLSAFPGKNVRGVLIDAFQHWLCVPDPILCGVKSIIADLHTASLLVDDIEDNSKLRRGQPVAHSVFGIAQTLNCANYVYFLALERVHRLQNPRAMDVTVKELLNLHNGQGLDILWRDSLQVPTEEAYLNMVNDKTGGLFRLAVGLMQAFSECETDFRPLLDRLALYFQIRDDLINLCDLDYMAHKSYCEDVTEGKFSFPIIHCIRASDDRQLLSILQQRTSDREVKRYAVELMRKAGSLRYTRETLLRLRDEADAEIERLGGQPALSKLLNRLDSSLKQPAEYE